MSSSAKPLAGKVAVVTGGGTGIGEACVRKLAAQGATVGVLGRRRELVETVAARHGGFALFADASKEADMQRAMATVIERHGRLDILIANAGGYGQGSCTETGVDDWRKAFDANLNTAFISARAALPHLLAQRGAIVFVASIAALAAGPQVCGYTTFKHALIGLSRSLARDYGPLGVRSNVVCPGWVRTPMADEEMQPLMAQHGISLDEAYALVTGDVPLRRPADPAEIAEVCAFLASPAASIVTGAVLTADGGATIVDVPTLAFTR
ncbi:MAG: short-chain dehydrogenase/reductase [Proteobacteria bacterium]|nr:short-chain dehydrogenase/reductase [Pseudomonadota bacterium]